MSEIKRTQTESESWKNEEREKKKSLDTVKRQIGSLRAEKGALVITKGNLENRIKDLKQNQERNIQRQEEVKQNHQYLN